MPEVLRSTAAYLKQCSTADPDDPIEIDPGLLDSLERAAEEAKKELLGKVTAIVDLYTLTVFQQNWKSG